MTKKRAVIWVCEAYIGEGDKRFWLPCPDIGTGYTLSEVRAKVRVFAEQNKIHWISSNGVVNVENIRFRKYISEKPL